MGFLAPKRNKQLGAVGQATGFQNRETFDAVTLGSCWNEPWEPGLGKVRSPESDSWAF